MRKTNYTDTERIILSRAIACGYKGFGDICEMCGFNKKTFWTYRKHDDFPLSWVRAIDKKLGLSDRELVELVRGSTSAK